MSDSISYDGIDEAVLIHGLYHGTRAIGMGHDRPGMTVEDTKSLMYDKGLMYDRPSLTSCVVKIDYFAGRPLKVDINTNARTVTTSLYDRDAGEGACQRVVDRLLDEATAPKAVAK